ncbi:MAG: DUF2334 domain-containing protein [Lachnospiraceae bacterium]|nr:DUF2334 domain-containing protein [Lachnospiraceae bacterium]
MYLLRLDDASEHWNRENWQRMHDMLTAYGIRPIVAIIPHNEDEKLLQYPIDRAYRDTIRAWIDEGWTPALHGYSHKYITKSGGINPVNHYSEFAGVSLNIQREKISRGVEEFKEVVGKEPEVFVAPAHTFDENTLEALRLESNIRVISDTIASDVYYRDDFYFIPQQSGRVRNLWMRLITFCYHPNVETDCSFKEMERFIEKYASRFVPFESLELKKREKGFYDNALSYLYFARRK